MAFWDNFSESITEKGKKVADKAKTFTDIASLKGQIASYENTILRTYKEIGHDYYAAHKDDENPEFEQYFDTIKKAEATIADLKKRIGELSGTRHCSSCDNDVPNDSVFCPKCGTKMEEDSFFDEEDVECDVTITEIIDDNSEKDMVTDTPCEEASTTTDTICEETPIIAGTSEDSSITTPIIENENTTN